MTIVCLILVLCFALGNSFPAAPVVQIDEQQDDEKIDLSAFGVMLFSEPDETVGKLVNDWTPDHDQNPEELGTYLEGDMLIPGVEGRNGLVKSTSKWPNGVVPFTFASSVSGADRQLIQRAMNEYHSKTCIRFVPRTSQVDFIQFENTATGCWSSVGRVGKKQTINLQSPGCTTKVGTAQHEIMHALAFLHEQNRYDRDSYVRILKTNIKPDTLPNFEKASPGETTEYGVQYDLGSVMHYSSTAFSKNGQTTIEALRGSSYTMGQRDGFAPSDLAKINQMYKCGNISPGINPGTIERPTYPRPTYVKPVRPTFLGGQNQQAGAGGFTNPLAQVVSGIGSFFSALGGKHDAVDNEADFEDNQID